MANEVAPPPELPPGYYLAHFEQLLDLVEAHDLHLLDADEQAQNICVRIAQIIAT